MTSSYSIRRSVADLPIPRKFTLIMGLFCLAVFALLALGYFGMDVLSGSRAYLGGEGFWSKAEKAAVYQLMLYAQSHEEADYQKYVGHMTVPLGDRQARLELLKPAVNYAVVAQGFLQGRNHPADVGIMSRMVRKSDYCPFMKRELAIWAAGDQLVDDLRRAAEALHREVAPGRPSQARTKTLLTEIQAIDARLTLLEDQFSYDLSEGGRFIKRVLWIVMLLTTASIMTATLGVGVSISRHLCRRIESLRAGAYRVTDGDYSPPLPVESKDEIGDLARTFQRMAGHMGHLTENLRRHSVDLAAANHELEAFSYSVSHDLRTPLRAINGFSQELLTNCASRLDERGKEDLQRIRVATQRMAQLIDDLLELSHLSRGDLTRAEVDLSVQVQEIAVRLKESNPERRTAEFTIAPHVTAQCDRRLLQIALENLIQNAWKFTRNEPVAKIEFGVTQQDGKEAYFVRDNGVGFDMAYAGRLFKPFQRLHDVQEFSGNGIGLALVHRIIHRHDGRIWAQAKENGGAAFFFTLP